MHKLMCSLGFSYDIIASYMHVSCFLRGAVAIESQEPSKAKVFSGFLVMTTYTLTSITSCNHFI